MRVSQGRPVGRALLSGVVASSRRGLPSGVVAISEYQWLYLRNGVKDWTPREGALDASGGIGVTERTAYILRVRQLAVAIARAYAGADAEAPAVGA